MTARSNDNPFHMIRDNVAGGVRLIFNGEEFCFMYLHQWFDMIAHPTIVNPAEEPEQQEEYLLGHA